MPQQLGTWLAARFRHDLAPLPPQGRLAGRVRHVAADVGLQRRLSLRGEGMHGGVVMHGVRQRVLGALQGMQAGAQHALRQACGQRGRGTRGGA